MQSALCTTFDTMHPGVSLGANLTIALLKNEKVHLRRNEDVYGAVSKYTFASGILKVKQCRHICFNLYMTS